MAAAEDVGEVEAEQTTDSIVVGFAVTAVNGVVVAADVANLLDRDGLDLVVEVVVDVVVDVGTVGGGRDRSDEGDEDGRGVHFVGCWAFKKGPV